MNVLETLEQVGKRLQIAFVVGSVPLEGGGDVRVLFANTSAAVLFGYASGAMLKGMDVRDLMPDEIAGRHREVVSRHVASNGAASRSSIMGSWRKLEAKQRDGRLVPVLANVARVQNDAESYFVAVFLDRREDVAREAALANAVRDAQATADEAERLRKDAERLRDEADEARRAAEDGMLRQRRLAGQIALLRQIFAGTVLLICMLGALVVGQWVTGTSDVEGIAMVERVLLVLTGILGSAMASVFDSRRAGVD